MLRKSAIFLSLLVAGIFIPFEVPKTTHDLDPQNAPIIARSGDIQIGRYIGMANLLPVMLPVLTPTDDSKTRNEEQQGFISIRGYLINFSGGDINFGTQILMTIFNGDQVLEILSTHLRSDQSFDFSLIPYNPAWTYVATFEHNGIKFSSETIDGGQYKSGSTVDTKIWVFDSTTDASMLRGEGMHVSIIFGQEDKVHIVQSMLFYNPTSMVIVPAGSESPVIMFPLNADTGSLVFIDNREGEELRKTAAGFGDWQMIYPGMVHQVMFEYDLPFDGNSEFEFMLPMHMESIMVMVQGTDGRIACSNPLMSQEIGNLAKPSKVINGMPQKNETSVIIHCIDRVRVLNWFIGISGSILIIVMMIIIVQQRKKKTEAMNQNIAAQRTEILDAIIALEDQYKAGEISSDVYTAKRAELVMKLELH